MAEKTDQKKVDLPDIMLAMDVVDTLRHQQSMVDRELDTDAYDKALIEKVRKIYADQGLEVSDEIIQKGVAALREDRFTYAPPKWRIKIALARIYVNRGRWAKIGGIVTALVVVGWLVIQLAVVGPANREKAREETRLATAWKQFQESTPSNSLSKVGKRLYQQARLDLEAGRNQAAISTITQLTALVKLPDQVDSLLKSIKREAKEEKATAAAARLHGDAYAALERGDIPTAHKNANTLLTLSNRLKTQYTLQVVSQPNTRSGVWRQSRNNPNAKNYYIIVEAISPEGKRIPQHITSEEDGKAKTTGMWGIRVPERVFNQIKRDKQDNGIIDNNRFGVKRRGYLTPSYQFPTAGGMITEW